MPKFLERKLKAEYGANSKIPYKIMNSIGAMAGNQETPKGKAMEVKHASDMKAGLAASRASHPAASRLGKFLHPKKAR